MRRALDDSFKSWRESIANDRAKVQRIDKLGEDVADLPLSP